jgi:hypothetical protein
MSNFKTLTEREKLIYFAGLVDGEGHIGCQYYGERKRPVIQINMTDKEVLSLFAEHFDIKLKELNAPSHIKAREEKGYKQQYQVRVECQKALPVIKDLYPFLVTKRIAAEKTLEYYIGRKCVVCGTEISETMNARTKYCSKKCRDSVWKNKVKG